MTLKSKKLNGSTIQRIIVAFCLFAVCVGTQQIQTVKWDTGIIEFSRDSFGVLMALILFTHYKWSDFVKYKLSYLIWTGLGLTVGTAVTCYAVSKRFSYLFADTIIIALGVFLMGYCIIHTIISFFIEKKRPKLYMPLFIIWIVMMLLMIFSRSEYLWPECYFVLFLCYYLTDRTQEQRRNVTLGIIDGIILGFIVIQAHSLLFRPYDVVRYKGNFCNPNHNCVFLCFCLAAILSKILYLRKEKAKKPIIIFFFLLAEACYSFIFMTISRSGYLATFFITIVFLILYCRTVSKKIFFRMGILLSSLFIVIMPLTYLAVRYIPTIHPHVLFYFQEGYSEDRVHSWDPRNSEKFISFEEMIQTALGRFKETENNYNQFFGQQPNPEVLLIRTASVSPSLPREVILQAGEILASNKIPALYSESNNAFVVRYTIYKWYWDHLSLRGMPYDEQGFQLTESHWIQDTHNIYLDYGINFGIPVMILFTVFIWYGIGRLICNSCKQINVTKMSCLLITLVPPIFGLFEFAWGSGMLYTIAFYLCFSEMLLGKDN